MRILLISAGLPDKRSGGMPSYLFDVMEELIARGHSLHYLDTSGRNFERKGIFHETTQRSDGLVVTRFYNLRGLPDFGRGTMDPLSQTRSEPEFREKFEKWWAGINVEVVHIHEFIGFPADAVSLLIERRIPVMATVHDFYALCPTVRLMLPDGQPCHLGTPDLVCRQCCRQGVSRMEALAVHGMERIRSHRGGSWLAGAVWPKILPLLRRLRWWGTRARSYRMRREDMLSLLGQLDLICGNSNLTANLYRRIGGLKNVVADTTFISKTVRCEATIRPVRDAGKPLRLLMLNVRRDHKGLGLMKRELAMLLPSVGQNLRLVAWGCSPIDHPLVENRGNYEASQLDAICADADVGLFPSVCQETYGFVGAEMLSRGLPIIASQTGAMKEYIEEGRDGLLFDPFKPGDLAGILSRLVADEARVDMLLGNAAEAWRKFNTFGEHVDQLVHYYDRIVKKHARQSAGLSSEAIVS